MLVDVSSINAGQQRASPRVAAIAVVLAIHIMLVLLLVSLTEDMAVTRWLPQSLQVNLFKPVPPPKVELPTTAKKIVAPASKKAADVQPKAPVEPVVTASEATANQKTNPKTDGSDLALQTGAADITKVVDPITTQLPTEAVADNPVSLPVTATSKSPVYERPLLPLNLPALVKFVAYQGEIEKGAVFGASTYKIDATPEGYQASLDIRLNWLVRTLAGGDRSWGSRGRLTDEGLRPAQMTERRGDRPERVTDLDLTAGVQDRVSLIWHFGLLARTFPEKFVSGYEFDQPLRVSSRIAMSRWRVTQENISVQGVMTATLAFTRIDTRDDDFRFDCWLDTNERMLPVRLRITGKGYVLDMIKDSTK